MEFHHHNFVVDTRLVRVLFSAHNMRTFVLIIPRKKQSSMEREFAGSFADFLALKRKDAGITIKDMAQKLKISAAYYSHFESGDRKAPEREVQDQLADILELSSAERLQLYDLAGQTRGIVAADLPDYIDSNPYVRVALRKTRDSRIGKEQWLAFIRSLDR